MENLARLLSETDDLAKESVDEMMGPFFKSVDGPGDVREQAKQVVVINMVGDLAKIEDKELERRRFVKEESL